MGNIVNTEITKDDICFDYIVDVLIKKHNYNLVETDLNGLFTNVDRTIVKIGGLYLIMIDKNEREESNIRYLISPLIKPLCEGGHVDKDYPLDSVISSDLLFIVGYPQANLCKIISFVTCSFSGDGTIPIIDLLCAMETKKTYVNKDKLIDVKVSLGTFTLFKCIQYLKEKGYKKIYLECHYSLLSFYRNNLFFKIGKGPEYNYNIKRNGEKTALETVQLNDALIKKDGYLKVPMIYDAYDEKYFPFDPKKAFKDTLFTMYLEIDKDYDKILRETLRRIKNINKAVFLKDLFDTDKHNKIVSDSPYYDYLVKYHDYDEI